MALQVRFELNRRGIGALARSEQLRGELLRRARRVEAAARAEAGPDDQEHIEATGFTGRTRARASVIWRGGLPTEVRDRVLGRAVDAARG